MSVGRIALLDALRGVAALTVAWHHVTVHFPFTVSAADRSWLHAASAWVSARNVEAVLLFFVLSGLSIRLSVQRLDLRKPVDVREYLRRRVRRILPLYLVSLAVAGLVALTVARASPSSMSLGTLAGNLLFLQTAASLPGTWFPPFAENGPLWSLSYEMFYYLAFPLLAQVGDRRWRLLLACAVTLAGLAVQQLVPNPFGAFAASFLVWYLGVELAEALLTGHASVPWWSFTVLAALVLGVLQLRESATVTGLAIGLAFFHLGYAVVRLARYGLRVPPVVDRGVVEALAWVGGFSYGLYLLHFPLLRAAAALSPDLTGAVLGGIASLSIAYAAERWTKPGRVVHRRAEALRQP